MNLENARRSNLMVVYAVQASMLSVKSHAVWDHVVGTIPREAGTDIEIVDIQGRILFSTDPHRRGLKLDMAAPPCSVSHRDGAAKASAETTQIADPTDDRYRIFATTLRNTRGCRGCHADGREKLGMVVVRQDLAPISSQVRGVQIAFIIAGIMALGLTILSTRLLLGRYLGRPMKKLLAGASTIGAGDLDHRIDIAEHTELRVLADTLNASAARLDELVLRLTRQRNDFQTLYLLVDQLSRTALPEGRRRSAVELADKLFGTDCLLVRPPSPGDHGTVTYPSDGQVVERSPLEDGEPAELPAFYSGNLVNRWTRGDRDGEFEVRDHDRVA